MFVRFPRRGASLALASAAVILGLSPAVSFSQEKLTERPPVSKRKFTSPAVEKTIAEVTKNIKDPRIAEMFAKCFPNTLDTTVFFSMKNGVPDTYVITGDIDAMWLRDSSAQVDPYLPLCKEDPKLARMINGLIRRQAKCILLDPYANAFYPDAKKVSEWKTDLTEMKPGVHERKYELDSLCYPIRLAYQYWKITGDTSAFDDTWLKAMKLAVGTMRVQQRKDDRGPYKFQRTTAVQTDTVPGAGWGNPIKPTGMICSVFRNSDDSATFLFNIPENLFAVASLRRLAEILDAIKKEPALAADSRALADEAEAAVKKYGIVDHPKYGKIYAYEVDGFGNTLLIDDGGSPGLIAIPFLGYGTPDDEVYKNSRRFALSEDNPFFYKGAAGEGLGSPHLAAHGDYIWPMGIATRGVTSSDPEEIKLCLDMIASTNAGTGFMHEGFDKNDAAKFTRDWFAWANTWFGEFVWRVYREKPELLKN